MHVPRGSRAEYNVEHRDNTSCSLSNGFSGATKLSDCHVCTVRGDLDCLADHRISLCALP